MDDTGADPRESLDLTERMPPTWEHDEICVDPPALDARPRAAPPPIPAAAARRRPSVPPPIPQRALAKSSSVVPVTRAPVAATHTDDGSIDIDVEEMPSFPSSEAPLVPEPALPAWAEAVPAPAARIEVVPAPWPSWSELQREAHPEPLQSPPVSSLAGAPRQRATLPPPMPLARTPRLGTVPPPQRPSTQPPFVVAPTAAPVPPVFPSVPAAPSVVVSPSLVAPLPVAPPVAPPDVAPPIGSDREIAWFDDSRLRDEEDASTAWDGTAETPRRAPFPIVKLGIAAMLAGGLSAATVIVLRGDRQAVPHRSAPIAHAPALAEPPPAQAAPPSATAPPTVAAPTAAAAEPPTNALPSASIADPPPAQVAPPTAAPAELPPPAKHQLPIRSEPAGATVALIDDGAAAVIGQTPLAVNLDPARSYDVVLTLAGYRTQVVHVDPSAKQLEIALAMDEAPPTRHAPIANKRTSKPKRAVPLERAAKRTGSTAPTSTAPRPTRVAAAPAKAGQGTLMVSSKPPCEIVVDGVATVLTTPQKIPLAAGKHRVTLFNLNHGVDATFEVVIEPGKPTKLIRDFMKR